MRRSVSYGLSLAALLISGLAHAEMGVQTAGAAARVSVSIPSLHGADIPSRPAPEGPFALAGSRPAQGTRLALPALSVTSSNGDAAIQVVRRVRDSGMAVVSSSPRGRSRAPEVVSTAGLSGAMGWTALRDELEIPAAAASSRGSGRVTVIYEVWPF